MEYKNSLRWAGLGLLALCLAAGATLYYWVGFPAFALEEDTYIYIRPDDTFEEVCRQIEQEGHPHSLCGLRLLASFTPYTEQVRSGRYALRPTDNMYVLFRRLYAGEQTPVDLVVPGVRTMDRLASALAKQTMLDSTAVVRALTDSAACARWGCTPQTLPCFILPNTYQVYWNLTVDDFMARMQKEHARFWNEARRHRAGTIGLTPHEVSTLASIVDEETAMNDEKPMVAGLYINRLRRGMLLQADPTVKFACGDFGLRRVLHKHLAIDSPYNTYKYPGLPPGPIRIPSIAAIESVLHYREHTYIYMCAKEDFSGYHNFASTLARHSANAARYQRELNRRRIR